MFENKPLGHLCVLEQPLAAAIGGMQTTQGLVVGSRHFGAPLHYYSHHFQPDHLPGPLSQMVHMTY